MKDTWSAGSAVKQLRERKKLSGIQLSQGLCSPATLSRIEADEREMELIFAVRIFERLGYYPDKYELLGNKDDYEQYEQRLFIQKLKRKRQYDQMALELSRYQKKWKTVIEKNRLHQQFVDSMQGFLYIQEKDGEKFTRGIQLLEKAIAVTMPDWKGDWKYSAIIGETELEILSALADASENAGKAQEAFSMRGNIYDYIEKKTDNRVQMLPVYTEIVCKLVPVILEEHNVGGALKLCEDALKALSDRGRTYHWPDLLYWKGRCLEELYRMGKTEKDAVTAAYMRSYYIYRLFGMSETAEKIKAYLDKEELAWECISLEKL